MARETAEERRQRARRIARTLARAYPDADCALHYENAFQLLVATILSAQCTDAMVNRVTAELFPKYGSPEALAGAPPQAVEKIVRPTLLILVVVRVRRWPYPFGLYTCRNVTQIQI